MATGVVRSLTSEDAYNLDAGWSPDGDRIAFQSTRDGRSEIYVMEVTSRLVRRVTDAFGFNQYPRWSPDASWIAFTSGRAGVKGPLSVGGFHSDVYLMRSDGSDVHRLTNFNGADGWATWSPAGDRLAFNSDRGGAFDVYTMNIDGRDQQQLSHHEGTKGFAAYPEWSPDGSKLVFNASATGDGSSIYVMSAKGGEPARVTRGFDFRPDWSRDGSWIAFADSRRGHTQLFVVRPDGSDLRQLTTDPGDKDQPQWRPG